MLVNILEAVKEWAEDTFLKLTGGSLAGNLGITGTMDVSSVCTSNNLFQVKYPNLNASAANNGLSSGIAYPALIMTDNGDRVMARFEGVINSNGSIGSYWYVRNYDTSGGQVAQKGISMHMAKNGTFTYNVSDAANFRSAIGAAASSDRRLKSDITPLGEDAVQFVMDLEPCVYTINGERQVGFIAQDIADSDPWGTCMAFETEEGLDGLDDWEKMPDGSATWKLDYIRTIPPIAAALKQAMERIDQLEARVAELEDGASDA